MKNKTKTYAPINQGKSNEELSKTIIINNKISSP